MLGFEQLSLFFMKATICFIVSSPFVCVRGRVPPTLSAPFPESRCLCLLITEKYIYLAFTVYFTLRKIHIRYRLMTRYEELQIPVCRFSL